MEHVLTICDLKENNLYIQFQNFKKKVSKKDKNCQFRNFGLRKIGENDRIWEK